MPSMSCRTMVYKGMFLAPQLFAYYPDLSDERVVTALAIVHQRYSTNTFPSWRLAQPFRMIAHNGEINTLRGNAQPAAGAARSTMVVPAARRRSVATCSRSCSPAAATRPVSTTPWSCWCAPAGRLPHAMMMMIPEAFGPSYHISTDKRAFYEYHAAIMEPWDGPAAMVFTDGRLVGGTLDRNGLRPCRYVVTDRRPGGAGQRGGRDRVPAGADPSERPAAARADVPGRHRRGPDRRRQRDQGQDRPPEAVSPLAGGEPHRAARAVPARRARSTVDPEDDRPAAAGVRLHAGRACR